MTAVTEYFEDQEWEDVVRDKMEFVSEYPDEIMQVIADAIRGSGHDFIRQHKRC